MKNKIVLIAAVAISVIALSLPLSFAEEETFIFKCNKEETPKIVITQTAKIEAEPDKAIINIGVAVEETKIEKAFEKNKEKMNKVIEILKQEGVDKKDIKTTQYDITPLYEGKPLFSKVHRPTSYVVTHGLSANIYKLEAAGKILTSISDIESVNVRGVQFTSTKMEQLKKEALQKAAQLAREIALAMVASAGGKLGKILRIEQSYASPNVYARKGLMDSLQKFVEEERVPAQVEAGTLTIEASCTVTYEVEKQ